MNINRPYGKKQGTTWMIKLRTAHIPMTETQRQEVEAWKRQLRKQKQQKHKR